MRTPFIFLHASRLCTPGGTRPPSLRIISLEVERKTRPNYSNYSSKTSRGSVNFPIYSLILAKTILLDNRNRTAYRYQGLRKGMALGRLNQQAACPLAVAGSRRTPFQEISTSCESVFGQRHPVALSKLSSLLKIIMEPTGYHTD